MPIIERLTPTNGRGANRRASSTSPTPGRGSTVLLASKEKEALPMTNDHARQSALQQLIKDDAVGQLRRHDGLMATLGTENGALKLDSVQGVARLPAEPSLLEQAATEAHATRQSGIRPLHWRAMG